MRKSTYDEGMQPFEYPKRLTGEAFNTVMTAADLPYRMRYGRQEGRPDPVWVVLDDNGEIALPLLPDEQASTLMAVAFVAGTHYGAWRAQRAFDA